MTEWMIYLILFVQSIGLLMGAAVLYIVLMRMKRYFLDIPPLTEEQIAKLQQFKQHHERAEQLKEFIGTIGSSLDKLSHNGG